MMEARDVLIRPILTESSYEGIEQKKYVFVVAKKVTKTNVKMAVEQLFGVKVEKVNTMNCRGKLKRMGRNEGYTPSYKKAIVQLTADSKEIEFFKSLS
ncbi:MAG: 50S ribosomal protein L23 [Clostridia bacterium]|nr:50S ribosomal protein L23 [Clostridia bacterium]